MTTQTETRAPASGWEYLVVGAIVSTFGWIVWFLMGDEPRIAIAGLVLAWAGGAATAIGVVALGVCIGLRRARYLDR